MMEAADLRPLMFGGAAAVTFGLGAGLLLYERFSRASRWYFLTTATVGGWLACIAAARLVGDASAAHAWLRAGYAMDALTGPAILGLVLFLTESPRRQWLKAAWVIGIGFALTGAFTDLQVDGILTLLRTGADGPAALAAVFFLFLLGCVAGAVAELLRAWRSAHSAAERHRHGLVIVALGLGSLTFLDLLLPWLGIRDLPVTPVAVAASTLVMGIAASRYGILGEAPTLATREVFRTMRDAVFVLDPEGRVRNMNPAGEALCGGPESLFRGLHASALFALGADDLESTWSDRETVVTTRSGKAVPVSVSTARVRAPSRDFGWVVVARDTSERVRATRALADAERRFTAVFRYSPAMAYEIAADGTLANINPAGEELIGEGAPWFVGRGFIELIEPDDRPTALELFEQVLSGAPAEYDLGLRRPDGRRRRIRGVSVPVREGDEVVSVLGVALDVTEETRAKHSLEVQRHYFAELFEASPEAVALVEADGRVRRVNGEFTRLFGYTREEVLGQRLDDLIVPHDRAGEGGELAELALTGGLARAETVRRRKEGGLVDVSLLARQVRIPGEPPQMYAVYRDITDRRAAERRLRQREEELRHAQKLEAVGKLAGGIAHDFNNLLTVINGHARFVLEQLGPGEGWRKDLEEIERAGSRAATLTQQLLAFSRRQVLRPQVLDLDSVILDLQRMLARIIGEHIDLVTDLMAPDARVRADRGQLEQVVMNLVVNARDAMQAGGTLTIATRVVRLDEGAPELPRWEIRAGSYVRLEVSDTGHGMDPETLGQAFEPFFTTKDRGKGTGLGLSTVFGIVKQTGGHITAESVPALGSRFAVLLPLADSDLEEGAPVTESGPGTAADSAGTVLVVEDEGAVRKLAVRVLQRAGHTVHEAVNGLDALSVLDRHGDTIELVLTDLVMPEMGGRDLRAALLRRRPDLPVVFMSGYDDEQALAGTDSDAGFLPKPFTPAALARAVATALQAASLRS